MFQISTNYGKKVFARFGSPKKNRQPENPQKIKIKIYNNNDKNKEDFKNLPFPPSSSSTSTLLRDEFAIFSISPATHPPGEVRNDLWNDTYSFNINYNLNIS